MANNSYEGCSKSSKPNHVPPTSEQRIFGGGYFNILHEIIKNLKSISQFLPKIWGSEYRRMGQSGTGGVKRDITIWGDSIDPYVKRFSKKYCAFVQACTSLLLSHHTLYGFCVRFYQTPG